MEVSNLFVVLSWHHNMLIFTDSFLAQIYLASQNMNVEASLKRERNIDPVKKRGNYTEQSSNVQDLIMLPQHGLFRMRLCPWDIAFHWPKNVTDSVNAKPLAVVHVGGGNHDPVQRNGITGSHDINHEAFQFRPYCSSPTTIDQIPHRQLAGNHMPKKD